MSKLGYFIGGTIVGALGVLMCKKFNEEIQLNDDSDENENVDTTDNALSISRPFTHNGEGS